MVVEGRPDGGMVLDQYPGFGLSISELCHALKLKLAQTGDSRHAFPLPLVKSLVDDIGTTVAPLCRTINHRDSWTHRLPPELLVAAASHLGDDESLIAATHVCHFWRMTLISSPRLWSHLNFADEGRALVYLERSKSVPLSVNLMLLRDPSEMASESLKKTTNTVATLWTAHNSLLDELLAQSMPMLEHLEILDSDELPPENSTHLPSLTSLVIHGFDRLRFHAPILTSFHLSHDPTAHSGGWTTSIFFIFIFLVSGLLRLTTSIPLGFPQSCPLLEIALFSCSMHPDSDEVVSLPLLRSFTHETPDDEYQLCLLDQLFLPPTCQVVLVADVTDHHSTLWTLGLPTPRDSACLSDIRTVKIAAHPHKPAADENYATFKIELVNSARGTISFDRISYYAKYPSHFSHQGFLDIFESIETGSVETLCFYRCPTHTHHELPQISPQHVAQGLRKFTNLKTLVLVDCMITRCLGGLHSCPTIDTLVVYSVDVTPTSTDVIDRVEEFVVSRKRAGSPLRALTLLLPFAQPCPLEPGRLVDYVGRVEVLTGRGALFWDLDKYLLSASTREDRNPSRL